MVEKDADTSVGSVEILGPFPVPKQSKADRKEKKLEVKPEPYPATSKARNAKASSPNPRPLALARHKTYPMNGTANTETRPNEKPADTKSVRRPIARSQSAQVGRLPLYTYKDYIPRACLVHTHHEEEADDLISTLAPGPIGFDMEWRFFLRRGAPAKQNRAAVVQLADVKGLILVIQVYHMKRFPRNLQAVIESSSIAKLGVNILGDGRKLFHDYGVVAKNLVELGGVAAQADVIPTPSQNASTQGDEMTHATQPLARNGGPFGRKMVSLAKLVERYCGRILEKGKERTSNWEAPLTQDQIHYAACDAHCAITINQRLVQLAKENNVTLRPSGYTSDVIPANYFAEATGLQQVDAESCQEGAPTTQDMRSGRQYQRAYKCWYKDKKSLETMCKELVVVGDRLKPSTVISYVIGALQADPNLPFNMDALRELVQQDIGSWDRHRDWILRKWAELEHRAAAASNQS